MMSPKRGSRMGPPSPSRIPVSGVGLARPAGRGHGLQPGLHFRHNPFVLLEADIFADAQLSAFGLEHISYLERLLPFSQQPPGLVLVGCLDVTPVLIIPRLDM